MMLLLQLIVAIYGIAIISNGRIIGPTLGERAGISTNVSLDIDINIAQNLGPDFLPVSPTTAISAEHPIATHMVDVGADDLLLFTPNHVFARIGEVLNFTFHRFNHTLTESTLEKPCDPIGRLDTGFSHNVTTELVAHQDSLAFTVQDWNPRWFFCRQKDPRAHCAAGMVFALNPGHQMQEFLDNANPPGGNLSTPTTTPWHPTSQGSANSARALTGFSRGSGPTGGTEGLSPSTTTSTTVVWDPTFDPQATSRIPPAPTVPTGPTISPDPFNGVGVTHRFAPSYLLVQVWVGLLFL